MPFPPLEFKDSGLWLLDQRLLPEKEKWILCKNTREVHRAIRTMVVRGAPAIGITAGYGLYLGIKNFSGSLQNFFKRLKSEAEFLKTARPTAVNLRNIVDRIVHNVGAGPCARPLIGVRGRPQGGAPTSSISHLKRRVLNEARAAHIEDDQLCRLMGKHGAKLLSNGTKVLTHCNAGGLATTGYGTALGVIYAAREAGKKISVYADETRPLLQGARLTAWELSKSRIPCTLICDNMSGSLMRAKKIDCVIVGADRIAANGDTANKIGTYNVAVLAKAHGIPFYVAAPVTTFDFKIKSGAGIPIEQRESWEITNGFGKRTAPSKTQVFNPAFDVTPYPLITAFITEAGVLRPPFRRSLKRLQASS